MAKKIEILENTLLKLLVRRGDNLDRVNVTLSEGELGYTTDGKRLFVGDGQTAGGIVVGNKWKGSVTDISTITDAITGDYAFESTSNIFYVLTEESTWLSAGRILEAGDTTIDIDDSNGTISVGTISGANVSVNALGNSIDLSNTKISLSSTQIKTDRVSAHSVSHLKLPQNININNVDYQFPVGGLGGANVFLRSDANGNLQWTTPEANTTVYFNSSSVIPVGTIIPVASGSSVPSGYLLCNGQSIAGADYRDLSAVIGSQYGGDDVNFNLPDYEDSVLYGVNSNPVGGTEYHLDTGTSGLSAKAVTFFIKALPDTVATPSFTLSGNLQASTNGTAVTEGESFDPFEDNVVISTPIPGVSAINTATAVLSTFTTKATYTKFWITGSGAKGGSRTGGAAATVTGVLSAPIGTTVDFFVGAGVTTNNTDGAPSYISIGGTELARSVGAEFQTSGTVPDGTTNTGNLSTNGTGLAGGESAYILGGHVIEGGRGGWDTDGGGGEEVSSTASFWGSDSVAGAGGGGHAGTSNDTADGLVKFEWGM
jgi:microcystin-dependent protein